MQTPLEATGNKPRASDETEACCSLRLLELYSDFNHRNTSNKARKIDESEDEEEDLCCDVQIVDLLIMGLNNRTLAAVSAHPTLCHPIYMPAVTNQQK
jgi:hypothetical protein